MSPQHLAKIFRGRRRGGIVKRFLWAPEFRFRRTIEAVLYWTRRFKCFAFSLTHSTPNLFSASAFRRLPEGQIESLWEVFAVQLREGWSRGGGRGGELLAKEVDAELFVLFVRNLHVTSSVASGVGRLCTSLAEEVGQHMVVSRRVLLCFAHPDSIWSAVVLLLSLLDNDRERGRDCSSRSVLFHDL